MGNYNWSYNDGSLNINSRRSQMLFDIPNVPKSILKAHEEQAYKTTPMILITEPFLI
jgi:hypothetical protein